MYILFWPFWLSVDLRLSARWSGSWWEICISSREVCVLCVFPSKHGSEFPDIYSLSDFADFVSDMSWKGNCPVCFQIITVRLPLNKDGVFKRASMIRSCINCRLKANVVTYSNTKFMRLTLATVFLCVCFLALPCYQSACFSLYRSGSRSSVPTTTCSVHPAWKCG